ncbi:dihydrofolate reductase [Halobellus clavatus]|jgi:dihydrofolate reductase|uniref:dihydrofolate reductase n=1 Tax=Halobellus clavatus TaxID=660517 RepID=A0A1H3HZ77_9EURY|nr:dihydrofolate reductase [Halobellus clavatus]SDY20129.1 dihydrofolate reductase [Halobellus clavatus]
MTEHDDDESDAAIDSPTDIDIVLIAAVAANRVIGRDGEMPWHLPADLKHFKQTTTDHPVILGRKTYETVVAGLGEPFPERTSVVLTSQSLDLPESAVVANSIEEALELARDDAAERGVDTVYVAGGGRIYEQFLQRASRLVLTEINEAHDGDTRFPAWDDAAWTEVERDERDGFDFVTYERVDE